MKPSLPSPGVSRRVLLAALAAAPALPQLLLPTTVRAQVPAAALASWNDTASRQAIVTFVQRVTGQGSPDFMPPAERIATFDNDGTLWSEHPMYVQLAFALDRVKAMVPMHPEWKRKQPFKAVLDGDMKTLAKAGERGLVELIMVTHAGMTTAEFGSI